MIAKSNWTIVSKENSKHRERFSKLLQDIQISESFPESESAIPPRSKLMVLGLDAVSLIPRNILPIDIVLVSLTYDLEAEALNQKTISLLKSMALAGAKFIVDCQSSQNKILSEIYEKTHLLKIVYGADIKSLLKIPFERGSFLEIICTRTWNSMHNNFALISGLGQLSELTKVSVSMLDPGPMLSTSIRKQTPSNIEFLWFEYFDDTELINLLSESWMYVSTSPIDGASISLMEALAAGRICLISDIDANKEFIEDGKNGFLFKTNDAKDLATRIKEIVQMPNENLFEISKNARATARKYADWEINSQIIKNFILGTST